MPSAINDEVRVHARRETRRGAERLKFWRGIHFTNIIYSFLFISGNERKIGYTEALSPAIVPLPAPDCPPARNANVAITAVTSCWPLGAVLGGAVSAKVIPIWGWEAVFFLAGVLPLVLALVLVLCLPESARYLVARGADAKSVAEAVLKVFPAAGVTANDRFIHTEPNAKGFPLKELFRERRAFITSMIWVGFFMNFLVLFFVFNWLPPLLEQNNVPIEKAVLGAVMFNLGGTAGCLLLGYLMRTRQFAIMAAAYAVGAISIAAVGVYSSQLGPLMAAVALAGFCLVGAQACGNALIATIYPTSIRSTAMGWAYGIGRLGSIVGPVAAGVLLTLGWRMSELFWIAAIPMVVAALAMISLTTRSTQLSNPPRKAVIS